MSLCSNVKFTPPKIEKSKNEETYDGVTDTPTKCQYHELLVQRNSIIENAT